MGRSDGYWRGISERLRILEECGIRRRRGITARGVVAAARCEDDPPRPELDYLQLIVALGFETARGQPLSNNVMWLDAECIYGPEDYVWIARRMSALASPYLPLGNLRVSFDDVGGHLTFMLDGRKFHWTVRLDNDWVDGSLFHRFARLLAFRKSPKRFTFFDLGGQDFLVGCATPAEVRRLKEKAGVWFGSLLNAPI